MRQPDTFHLDPWCWYHCVEDNPAGAPRQTVFDPERCECMKEGCRHGQDLQPRIVLTA